MIISDAHNFASKLSRDMDKIHQERQAHIEKLSTGLKVNQSPDDVGALSNKIMQTSELKRLRGVTQGLQNALSYTQVQTGALNNVNRIYGRMSQLAAMAMDITKSDLDRENYNKEFQELREHILQIDNEQFNGQDLFRNTKYAVINTGPYNWTDARAHAAAANASDPEYDHYLATITSSEEQDEINRQLRGSVAGTQMWLGGSDSEFNGEAPGSNEGDWRWVEGPEGLENGGRGRLFWQGKGGDSGGALAAGMYENWERRIGTNNDEPNQSGGNNEDALQITTRETWNDLRLTARGPTAYLRESDPNNLRAHDDAFGGFFELARISFKRFLPSTTIDLTSMANAKDAMSRIMDAQEDVIDKIALAGSNESRLNSEISALANDIINREKSLSRIEDVDMAITASRLARAEIKMQSTTAIFAQANKLFNQRNYVEDLLS
jgi:flagellin-like hook-associated protein FlgL